MNRLHLTQASPDATEENSNDKLDSIELELGIDRAYSKASSRDEDCPNCVRVTSITSIVGEKSQHLWHE